jgi:hypothetical protein
MISPPKVSRELSRRQEGQPREVVTLSWKAQNRLHQRFMRLAARRLQRNKALVAVARELCFVHLGVAASTTVLFGGEDEVSGLKGPEQEGRGNHVSPEPPPPRGTLGSAPLDSNTYTPTPMT